MSEPAQCTPGCAACCIAPAISSAIPGMPAGKPAGVRCVQLDDRGLCRLFESPDRPAVCREFSPSRALCAAGPAQALAILEHLELQTRP